MNQRRHAHITTERHPFVIDWYPRGDSPWSTPVYEAPHFLLAWKEVIYNRMVAKVNGSLSVYHLRSVQTGELFDEPTLRDLGFAP